MMLPDLVRQARRRLVCNQLFVHGANAITAALAAFILLLLVGTQVLEWRWAALIPAGVIAYGLYFTWRRVPDAYSVAQTIDRRLGLADTLSTALWFDADSRRGRVAEYIRCWQYEKAERLSATVDVREAIPFALPRGVYAAAALLLVASSLFALRYGLSRTLDLRPPLARIINQSLGGQDAVQEASGRKKDARKAADPLDQKGISLNDRDAESLDPASQDALAQTAVPDVDNSRTSQPKANGKSPSEEGDQIALDEPGEDSNEGGAPGGEKGEGQKGSGTSKEGQQQSASNQQGGSSEKNSLLDKFREAMQNMMSKMKQQPQGGSQQAQMAQNGKQGANKQGSGKQNDGQGQKQRNGGQQGESQEGEAGDDAQADQDAQARGTGQNGEQQANKQPGSGIGKQDGDKDVKLAEQMAAMGKLSEIIGKRSANVTGEAMVEVKQTSQQLSTRYEAKRATHGESGAEISRDEVPVALQGYVQQYFEQVRKADAKK